MFFGRVQLSIQKIFSLIYIFVIILAFLLAMCLWKIIPLQSQIPTGIIPLLIYIAIVLIGILITILLLNRSVIVPISVGTRVVEQLIEGIETSRWYVPYKNELATLADVFNEMVSRDQKQRQDLESKIDEIQNLLQTNEIMRQEILEHTKIEAELSNKKVQLLQAVNVRNQDLERAQLVLNDEIQEKNRIAEELKKAKEAAEKANTNKSIFIASVSHELRNHLSGISALIDVLLHTSLTNEQRHSLRTVKDISRIMLQLIGDVLDISQIEFGKFTLENKDFDTEYLVQTTLRPFHLQVKNKGLYLQTSISKNVPKFLKGDSLRLRQILSNLINNAIKFTEKGGISLEVKDIDIKNFEFPQGKTLNCQEEQAILFSVQDTGIGIPEDKQDIIFDSFNALSNITRKKYGGTGLGLSICQKLVEMMGGCIWVESHPQEGSTFYFVICFPFGDSNEVRITKGFEAMKPSLNTPLNILLAEDNLVNAQMAKKLLNKLGHSVTMIENGKQVLEKLPKENFDLIFMDIEMPEMDGLEATKRIRQGEAGEKNQKIPIFGITAHTMSDIYEKCFIAGMNNIIIRPINFDDLRGVLQEFRQNNLNITSRFNLNETGRFSLKEYGEITPHDEILDIPGALSRLGGDHVLLQEMYKSFLSHFPKRMSELSDVVSSNDIAKIAFHSHAIKGTTSQIGATSCALLATAMEKAANENNINEIMVLFQRLEKEAQKVIELLEKN